MATTNVTSAQSVNTKLILLVFAAMTLAFAFIAILTNMIVNSKVGALTEQLSAYQHNPVTVASSGQVNGVGCISPNEETANAGSTAGTQTNTLPWQTGNVKYLAPLGNYSQSNSSVTNTTSTNTFVNDSYNSRSSVVVANNGNTDNRFSGNAYTDNRNSGNTTTTTVVTAIDNSNNSVNNSGNTTITDNSVNDSGNITDNSVTTNTGVIINP